MIKSMTGFGKGEHSDGKRNIVVEVKSVNHRYSDVFIKMPRRYSFAEEMIRKEAKKTIKRGKVEISVNVENLTEDDVNIMLNSMVANQYVDRLRQLKEDFSLDENISLGLLASFPDVLKAVPDVEDEKAMTKSIVTALNNALDSHNSMRMLEGEKLAADLKMRGEYIQSIVAEIEKRAPKVEKEYMKKLESRMGEILQGKIEVPEERILLETAIFADKASITEELVRLNSHIFQLGSILDEEKSEGKKLDFLIQEMNREANTIGSKANDIEITNQMLAIKSEVEKIREQVQNIE